MTAEPLLCPVVSRKLVRSCRAELVLPDFSAVLNWFSRFVSGFVDCELELLLVEEVEELEGVEAVGEFAF